MKLLVIGSKGFIGSNCLHYFSKANNDVWGADILEPKSSNYFLIDKKNPAFDSLFSKHSFDVCINASGSADVGFSISNPEKDFELNVKNVELILEAIRKNSPACRFINFSSAAVYGNPVSLPVNESAVAKPLSPYGEHKLKSELLLKEYHNKYGLFTCSMRVFSAYGPGLKKQLFWNLFQKGQAGKKVTLFGTGEESRDFIFIDDLMQAVDVLMQKTQFAGEAVNVSSGVETKIKDAARIFLSSFGSGYSLEFSGEEKVGDPMNWRADISLLKQMGFSPFVTFEEGITRTTQWLKELRSV